MKAWHFLKDDCSLRNKVNGRKYVKPGLKLTHKGPLILCESGLHASVRLIDALKYAPGSMLCRVECGGEIKTQTDKLVCTERTVEYMLDATDYLHEFACLSAEWALNKFVKNPDPRSLAAIQAKRDWLKGKITDQELAAAYSAANSAAYSAAYYAANSEVYSAARYAAHSAARYAAHSAARYAAHSAANSDLNTILENMIEEVEYE